MREPWPNARLATAQNPRRNDPNAQSAVHAPSPRLRRTSSPRSWRLLLHDWARLGTTGMAKCQCSPPAFRCNWAQLGATGCNWVQLRWCRISCDEFIADLPLPRLRRKGPLQRGVGGLLEKTIFLRLELVGISWIWSNLRGPSDWGRASRGGVGRRRGSPALRLRRFVPFFIALLPSLSPELL